MQVCVHDTQWGQTNPNVRVWSRESFIARAKQGEWVAHALKKTRTPRWFLVLLGIFFQKSPVSSHEDLLRMVSFLFNQILQLYWKCGNSFWSWMQLLYPDTKLILRDRVLGEVEKNSFIAFPGKGPQWANALKTVYLNLEGVVRSFIVMVQGGCDQLVDNLLTGWWWGKWESASSTFWFQPVWDLRACGQHTVNFSHLMGVSVSAK